jgi:predicted Zn finger-like uncharacterized protein
MIIECPACSTQYDIKVELPPEGRTVRCAKCENVWRATPVIEEAYPASEAYGHAGGEEAADTGYSARAGDPGGWGPEAGEDEEARAFSQGYYQDTSPQQEEAPGAGYSGFSGSGAISPEAYPAQEEAPGQEAAGGDRRWFSSFMRRNQPPAPPAREEASDPGPAGPAAEANHGVRSLDDARAAVRNVFASLGEQRLSQHASSIQAPVTACQPTEQEGYRSFSPPEENTGTGASGWDASPEERGYSRGGAPEGFTGTGWHGAETAGESEDAASQGWVQGWPEQEQEQEPEAAPSEGNLDTQLRAALQAHFPSHTDPGEEAQTSGEPQYQQEEPAVAAGDDEEVSQETLTAFWQRPLPPHAAQPAGEAFPLGEEEDGAPAGEAVFDERLFRELEESRELAQQQEAKPRKQNGALALAAAWGLFLCVAGGLTGGLLGFRDMAADAVPGLAAFYRTIGMPVIVQPLIFESIKYEWTVVEFKPVLHIKGAVYNRARRAVDVPGFVISVKDNDPAHDKEFPESLPVADGKIEPGERAEFDVELASVGSSVTTVELELRHVQ